MTETYALLAKCRNAVAFGITDMNDVLDADGLRLVMDHIHKLGIELSSGWEHKVKKELSMSAARPGSLYMQVASMYNMANRLTKTADAIRDDLIERGYDDE